MICEPSKFHSLNFSAVLIYTSNNGWLSTASLRISLVILNRSRWVLAPVMSSSVPSRLREGSFKSSSFALPVYSLSSTPVLMIRAFVKFLRRVLILIVSNDVRNDSLPVPYLPVLILFSLGETDSVLLWGEPKSRNFSIPFSSIPASSSIAIEPLLRTVTRTFVASSSKAFSTSSFMISIGETQVLVANSLKNEG